MCWLSDAVGDVYTPEPAGHGYASPLDGVAMSLKAGTDMDCGDWGKKAYLTQLPAAVKAGKVSEADLDKALVRLTTMQMELGLFDPKAGSHFFTLGVDLIHSDEHTRHALEAAQQAIVLLKNEQVLPLKKGGKIAVLGPHSDGHDVFLSNYHGSGCLNATGGIGGSKTFDCIQSPLSKSLVLE
jgi:beta-glucosidase|eukprot:COSAG02_NODE_3008_length_7563_cov_3.445606_3_plen_183_part_00